MLGYFIQDDHPELLAAMATLRARGVDRIETMAARLQSLGLSVDLEALRRAFPRANLGRRHFADYLGRTRQVINPRDAFARYLGDGCPAHVRKPRLDYAHAIALIQAAGGIAGLAHPPHNLAHAWLRDLVNHGMRAIEVNGPGFSSTKCRRFKHLADRLGLVGTAGSDFHAPGNSRRWIGAVTTPLSELEKLRAMSHLKPASQGAQSPATDQAPNAII
jgi:predicted metal-dependent phosphoesterase TrpH